MFSRLRNYLTMLHPEKPVFNLNTQYRMPHSVCDWFSNQFYDRLLLSAGSRSRNGPLKPLRLETSNVNLYSFERILIILHIMQCIGRFKWNWNSTLNQMRSRHFKSEWNQVNCHDRSNPSQIIYFKNQDNWDRYFYTDTEVRNHREHSSKVSFKLIPKHATHLTISFIQDVGVLIG